MNCRVGFIILSLAVTGLFGNAQSPYTPDAGKVGLPMNGVFSGGSIDSVQVNNGNLHVDIPLLHLPGVGMDADFHFVYDNQVFTRTQVPWEWSGTSQTPDSYWYLLTMSRYFASINDPLSGYLKIGSHGVNWECGNPQPSPQYDSLYIDYVSYTEPNGTARPFPVNGYALYNLAPCAQDGAPYYQNSFSSDSSGYSLVMDTSGNETSLTDKHGTRYAFSGSVNGGNVPVRGQNPNVPANPIYLPTILYYYPLSQIEDTNGNRIIRNSSGNIVDTLSRVITETPGPAFGAPIAVEALGNQLSSISYTDQNGLQQTISIGYGAVQINLQAACMALVNCGPTVGTAVSTVTVQLPSTITLQNGEYYTINYVPASQGGMGEIESIILPTGGTISYTYGPASNVGGSISRPVLTRTVNTGDQASTWTFNTGIISSATTPAATNGVTDPYGNDTYYTCGLASPACFMTNEVMFNGPASAGVPLATRSTTYTQYGCTFLPSAELFTWNESGQTTETDMSYDSIPLGTSVFCSNVGGGGNYATSTSRGNPYSKIIYDYGTSLGTHGALISNTQYAYLHDSSSSYAGANIADRVSQVSVYNSATPSSSALVAQTTTGYDGFNSGGQSGLSTSAWASNHDSTYGTGVTLRGLPTSVTKYVSGSSSITTNTNYNTLGQPTALTDGRSNTTTVTYSTGTPPGGSGTDFLVTTTLPQATNGTAISHISKVYEDLNTSLVMGKTDQNQNLTSYAYDPLMRVLKETRPQSGGSTTYSYDPNHVTTVVTEDAARSISTTVTLDGVGRKSSSSTTTDALCGSLIVDTYYDLMNRVQSVSNPHCMSSQVTDGYTSFIYDALGRMSNKQNPDASAQTWNFKGSYIDFKDETARHWQHVYDAEDRLVNVFEPDTSNNPTTETDYGYDAVGNLLRVDQWGGATWLIGRSCAPVCL